MLLYCKLNPDRGALYTAGSWVNKKLSYRIENRASAWCILLVIMLLSGIWLLLSLVISNVVFGIKYTATDACGSTIASNDDAL